MRKFLTALIIIIPVIWAGIFYLNTKVLPTKIKGAIVSGLETATGKKVLLGSVRFHIFKGLVLKDLIIRDDLNAIVNVKEARCTFLILPLVNKKVIISRLIFESPDIFIERRADGSVNILELFSKGQMARADFKAFVHRLSIRNGTINFHDLTLDPIYTKEMKNLDADIYILPTARIKYSVKFDLPSEPPLKIDSSGEYSIPAKELTAELRVKGFSPKEFAGYYEKTGILLPEGRIDSILNFKYKDGTLSVNTESDTRGLTVSKDTLSLKMSGSERSTLRYDFASKKLDYTGSANIESMVIKGVEYIGKIDNIKGRIEFSNLGLSSDNITARALDLPLDCKITIADFNNPVLNIDASSDIKLAPFQNMLKEQFELTVPAYFDGDAKLRLSIQYPITAPKELRIKGSLYALKASAKLNKGKAGLGNVTGKFQFVPNQVSWDDVSFLYHDIHYKTSGILTNFKTPGVQLKLSSKDISLDTAFGLNDKIINFSKFSGKYLNSGFSGQGVLDSSSPSGLKVDINGILNVDLEDLKKPFEKFKNRFERIEPKGFVRAEFGLKGDLKDLKTCAINANLSSDGFSVYGFKFATSTMNYNQKDGSGDILFMRSFLYGGSMGATGKIDWTAKDVPYRLDMDIDGIRIEKFKMDTAFKDKDIAGSIKMSAKIKGFLNDAAKISGKGKIAVTEGKLWQLNLFRGLGALLFTSDFNNIIFKEGHCDFEIGDKALSTDEITLKSELVDIYGPMKIGFDNSVSATMKVEFSDDALESSARQNIIATLGKYSLTVVSGTLKDPKYKVRPDTENIVNSFVENFSGE